MKIWFRPLPTTKISPVFLRSMIQAKIDDLVGDLTPWAPWWAYEGFLSHDGVPPVIIHDGILHDEPCSYGDTHGYPVIKGNHHSWLCQWERPPDMMINHQILGHHDWKHTHILRSWNAIELGGNHQLPIVRTLWKPISSDMLLTTLSTL